MEKSPLKAIRQHCLECCCGSAYEVKNCVIHDCELYPFRLGNNPFRTRSMTDEQKQAAAERLKSARMAKKSLTNNEANSDQLIKEGKLQGKEFTVFLIVEQYENYGIYFVWK